MLFGHSMGGCIALNVAIARPDAWACVLLSSPLTDIKDEDRAYIGHIDVTLSLFSLCCDTILPAIAVEKVGRVREGGGLSWR